MNPKKLIIGFIILYIWGGCTHGKKTYPDISGLWYFSCPTLDHIDTSNSIVNFVFQPYPDHSICPSFFIDKMNDSNTLFQIRCGYMEKNNISGTYFQTRMARVNEATDSISFSLFEGNTGDSIGMFTGKYDKKKDQLKGKFYTFYQMYCFCPYSGRKLQYTHEVAAGK